MEKNGDRCSFTGSRGSSTSIEASGTIHCLAKDVPRAIGSARDVQTSATRFSLLQLLSHLSDAKHGGVSSIFSGLRTQVTHGIPSLR